MHRLLLILLTISTHLTLNAQDICTFSEPALPVDTFEIDFSANAGFECGNAFFQNEYFSDFGGLWKSGWAVSSKTDLVDRSENNLLTAVTGTGASASPMMEMEGNALQYGVGQQGAYILLDPEVARPLSMDITNTVHAFHTLIFGNEFARPMGGSDGGDPDFFLLTIQGHLDGVETGEFIEFFLADYRFLDNNLDYIVDTWETIDLSPIAVADSITFTLTSSDVGEFGINQPPYFAVDNFTTELLVNTAELPTAASPTLRVFPNPTRDQLRVASSFQRGQLAIYDSQGQLVRQQHFSEQQVDLSVADLPKGIYFIRTTDGEKAVSERFIKL